MIAESSVKDIIPYTADTPQIKKEKQELIHIVVNQLTYAYLGVSIAL